MTIDKNEENVNSPRPNACGEAAIVLLRRGYSPLPIVAGEKRPAISKWQTWCTQSPDAALARQWWRDMPNCGLGVTCGRGLIAIDFDDERVIGILEKVLPVSNVRKIGKRGRTDFFFDPSGNIKPRKIKGAEGMLVEILATGNQTLIPPTIHPETHVPYRWLTPKSLFDLRREELTAVPVNLSALIEGALAGAGLIGSKPAEASMKTAPMPAARMLAYALTALQKAGMTVAAQSNPGRNEALFNAVCSIGRFVHHGVISELKAWAEFREACASNGLLAEDGEARVRATFDSGLIKSRPDVLPILEDRPMQPRQTPGKHLNGSHKLQDQKAPAPPPIVPKPVPLLVRPESQIERRDFLYGDHYIRGYVSMTAAPGGTGKTAIAVAEALAMATKRPLLSPNIRAKKILKVWYIGEDDMKELERRFVAAMKLHGIRSFEPQTLFVNSLDDVRLIVYDGDEDIASPSSQTRQTLIDYIKDNKIDVIIVDPFADTHTVDENRNGMIGRAVLAWREVARKANCAIELITHTRKPIPGMPATIEDARGGRAQIDRARHGRILIRMTEQEATAMTIEADEAFRYVRFGAPKANMAPSISGEWMKLESVWLENGLADIEPADNVQVAIYWKCPHTFEDISFLQIDAIMREIETGIYRRNYQSQDWAGHMICEKLGFQNTKAGRKRASDMLRDWEKSGAIRIDRRKGESRHEKEFYLLGDWDFSVKHS